MPLSSPNEDVQSLRTLKDIRQALQNYASNQQNGVAPVGKKGSPQGNEKASRDLTKQMLAESATASGIGTPEQQLQSGSLLRPKGGSPGSFAGAQVGMGGVQPLSPLGGQPGDGSELFNMMQDRHQDSNAASQRSLEGGEGNLSPASIAHLAKRAGFSGNDLVKAVAVAMAESRGNPRGRGDVDLTVPGEKSVGLWQINYRPGRDEGSSIRDPNRNIDPWMNAQNAKKIYDQQGWGAWSVTHGDAKSNNNHYSNFLDEAKRAVQGLSHRSEVR